LRRGAPTGYLSGWTWRNLIVSSLELETSRNLG